MVFGYLGGEQKDEAKDRSGDFPRFDRGVGADIGSIPGALFECGGVRVFSRWNDPEHSSTFPRAVRGRLFQLAANANGKD